MSEQRLSELDADWWHHPNDPTPAGVMFDCPVCTKPATAYGHSILVPWRGPSPFANGHLWTLQSSVDFDALTLSPSVNLDIGGKCTFHGWVQNGMVRW